MSEARDWRSEPVSSLALSVRAQRYVESTRVATVGELCDLTEDEFLEWRGFGETALREIRDRLAELGLRFRHPSEPQRHPRRRFGRADEPALGERAHWSLAVLELSARACSALEAGGLIEVGALVSRSAEELSEVPGVDAAVLAEVAAKLAGHGLRLGMRLSPE